LPDEYEFTPVEIRTEEHDGVVVVALAGELDMTSAEVVVAALERAAEASPRLILLDLHRLSFLDSTGARILFDANLRAGAQGHQIAVLEGSGAAHRVLELTDAPAFIDLPGRPGGTTD